MPFLPILAIMIITLVLMALALWFSKYKKETAAVAVGFTAEMKKVTAATGKKRHLLKSTPA